MKWEINSCGDWEEANELSADGWELVSVVYERWENRDGGHESQSMYYFKRPVTVNIKGR